MSETEMMPIARELWPIYRTITGPGFFDSLRIIQSKILPELEIKSIPTGKKVFDWTIPEEYSVEEAWIENLDGNRICEFSDNNLHLVGFSISVDTVLPLIELQKHLHSLPDQPEAIPYVTSYYKKTWGFCISQRQRDALTEGSYRVHIKSSHQPGVLRYGELVIRGESRKEILLSTYLCHPSMANNELSGPVTLSSLARTLLDGPKTKFSYRILILPETIGAIAYIDRNLKKLQRNTFAGYTVTCIGDEGAFSFLKSKFDSSLTNKIGIHVTEKISPNHKIYSWLERGSDERQYSSPGVDLPIGSIMKTKYWEYAEYHTSEDKLDTVVTEKGLTDGLAFLSRIVEVYENLTYPVALQKCEPMLSRHNLYPTTSIKNSYSETRIFLNVLSYSDGHHSVLDIAEKLGVPVWEVNSVTGILERAGLLKQTHTLSSGKNKFLNVFRKIRVRDNLFSRS